MKACKKCNSDKDDGRFKSSLCWVCIDCAKKRIKEKEDRRTKARYILYKNLSLKYQEAPAFRPGSIHSKSDWDDNNKNTWTWQIDHIVPQAILKYTSTDDNNFKQYWALNNLRPLSAKQNFLDGRSRIRHKKVA